MVSIFSVHLFTFSAVCGGPPERPREQIMALYGSHKSRQSNPSSPWVNCNYSPCPFRLSSSWDNYTFPNLKASLRRSVSVVLTKCFLSTLKGAEIKTLKTTEASSILIQNMPKIPECVSGAGFHSRSYQDVCKMVFSFVGNLLAYFLKKHAGHGKEER